MIKNKPVNSSPEFLTDLRNYRPNYKIVVTLSREYIQI